MGAWSHGSFENDDALDWVVELADSESFAIITETIDAVIAAEGEYLDASNAMQALAAAEVVATLLGKPPTKLPSEVSTWVKGKKPPDSELITKTQRAVIRIFKDSELRELWVETGDFSLWQNEMSDLQKRLDT